MLPVAECKNGALSDFFFTGFEDGGTNTVTGTGHTGTYFYNGHYPLNFAVGSNPAGYLYSYWYRSGGRWKFSGVLSYTAPLTITAGDAIDDVRVYPADAQMTTYTYLPLVGQTSVTDQKNMTTYYEYDNFHRLMNIKDPSGNMIKHIDYHISGQ